MTATSTEITVPRILFMIFITSPPLLQRHIFEYLRRGSCKQCHLVKTLSRQPLAEQGILKIYTLLFFCKKILDKYRKICGEALKCITFWR